MKSILPFLRELERNNNREWFNANKSKYLEAKNEFEEFIEILIAELQIIDPRVAGATAKNTIFRIYKDTRFSNDKTPYKTNMGAYIIGGGRKAQLPGYYVHFQPGESFLAGGMYQPGPDSLKAIRKEISNFPEDLSEIMDNKYFKDNFSFYDKDKLKRPPQGYSSDSELIEMIKNKHFIASKNIPEEWINSPELKEKILSACQGLLPLNNFLYRAISEQDRV